MSRIVLTVEASRRPISLQEFGEVLEVFVIDSKAMSNVGCAFVRMSSLEQAETAIQELHEQRVLIPEERDLGPMQVAFAKGNLICDDERSTPTEQMENTTT